jgi:fatty acid desaturase
MQPRLNQPAVAKRLLPPGDPRLRALLRRRPFRVAADVLRSYALIALAFWALVRMHSWWVWPLAFLIIGTQQYSLFILGHDGMHRTLARNRRLNDALTTAFLLAPLGTRVGSARTAHLNHHWLLGSDADPDRHLHIASNKATRASFLFFLTGLATVPLAVGRVLGIRANRDERPVPGAQPAGGAAAKWPVLAAQILVLAAISTVLPWWYYLAFWVLPVYALVFLTDEIRAFCEHAYAALPDVSMDGRRLVTFVPGLAERILFAPQNMNYHAEHHLWSFVPYYNLPEAHRLIAGCEEIEVRHSYLGFLWEWFRRLPLREERAAAGT